MKYVFIFFFTAPFLAFFLLGNSDSWTSLGFGELVFELGLLKKILWGILLSISATYIIRRSLQSRNA